MNLWNEMFKNRMEHDWEGLCSTATRAYTSEYRFAIATYEEVFPDIKGLMEANIGILLGRKMYPVKVGPKVLRGKGFIDYVSDDFVVELKTSDRPVISWIRQVALYRYLYSRKRGREYRAALHLARHGKMVAISVPDPYEDTLRLKTSKLISPSVSQMAKDANLFDQYDVLQSYNAVEEYMNTHPVKAPAVSPSNRRMLVGSIFDKCVKIVLLNPISWVQLAWLFRG